MRVKKRDTKETRPYGAEWYAIAAAVLFGIAAPFSKLLLDGMGPVTLAAVVYTGAALGMTCYYLWIRSSTGGRAAQEAPFIKADIPWIASSIVIGCIGATILLMVSLQYTQAATAALLLSFEGVTTTLIAVFIFKEQVSLRIVVALGLITLACILISYEPGTALMLSLGSIGILLTCTAWGIETNLNRHLSGKDPVLLNTVRAWISAGALLLIAFVLAESLPAPLFIGGALILGCISFSGVAAIWFFKALRGLGAARTGSIIGMNPIFGILVSFLIFQTLPEPVFFIAFFCVIIGLYFLFSDRHVHLHTHPEEWHEHSHHHMDGHHNHQHEDENPPVSRTGYHSHLHHHTELVHNHPHKPDIHHRHRHSRTDTGTVDPGIGDEGESARV